MAYMKQLGTTVVVITHKVSLLSNVDKLLVLQDGALAVFGPREGVLQHLAQQQQKQQQALAAAQQQQQTAAGQSQAIPEPPVQADSDEEVPRG
jgi:ABC-type protease/lipase transport system fused ATPase/permease subunit